MNYPVKAQPQLTLPATWYHTPEIFERERRRAFAREWQFIGPVSHLPNPGDYLAVEITGWRVFVIRDRDHVLSVERVEAKPKKNGSILRLQRQRRHEDALH